MTVRKNETYLGDGVYASFDGYQIWLRAPWDDVVLEVALDPAVFEALVKFAANLSKRKK